jgi:hypothetical protein
MYKEYKEYKDLLIKVLMYKLVVGALFKNESHILKEWVEHYLYHGVEHFFLIDDNSTDNSVDILQPYIKNGIITLFQEKCDYFLGRQMYLYNKCIFPHYKESEWLLMVDLDEFVWSPLHIDLRETLKMCSNIGQIQIHHTLYGSSGHIKQPESVVKHFTHRTYEESQPTNLKYFLHSTFEFTSLAVHNAFFKEPENEQNGTFLILGPEYFIMNHYSCQSLEFWNNVKCVRGDSDNYRIRNTDDFQLLDKNDVEDRRLLEQNKGSL